MDDDPGGAAAALHNQVHGWSSYSLSLPSQPPDIRNWFASYEYESPDATEPVADPGAEDGSETQDPFQHFPPDDGVAVSENRLARQSENECFDKNKSAPTEENESILQKPPKRKQSLRALFSFLDKHEEATEPEFSVSLPVQTNALEPLLHIRDATGLLDAKQSQEGAIKCGKVPVDCNGISSLDTQVNYPPGNQEAEVSKLPVTYVVSSLAEDGIDSIKNGKMLVGCEGISSVETQVSSPADRELEYCKLPVNCLSPSLAGIQKCLPEDSGDSIEQNKLLVDSGGISSVDTQVSSPADEEVEYSKLPVVSGLADSQQEDGIDRCVTPISIFGTSAENGSLDDSEHDIFLVRPDNTILADTSGNSPVKEISYCKPAPDRKVSEQTVASDGFVSIKRKHRLPEECEANNVPEYKMRRDKAACQENRNVLGQKVLGQAHTRSPLADRSNFPEEAAAPMTEFCGKWKCPSRGKPRVGPPMKQLRLDQWLR